MITSRHTLRVPSRAWFAACSLVLGCNARLAVSNERVASNDAGLGGAGSGGAGSGSAGSGSAGSGNPDASDAEPTTCGDGIVSGDETDIDCGGTCGPCADASSCARHTDCRNGVCRAGLCAAAACDDGVHNGSETAVDCGGAECVPCLDDACQCGTSAALMPIGCEARPDEIFLHSLHASDDGGSIAYGKCYGPPGSGMTGPCTTFKWAGSAVLGDYADTAPLVMAIDGSAILVQDGAGVAWIRADGTKTAVPFGVGANMSLDGRVIFGVTQPDADGVRNLARWTEAAGVEPLGSVPGTWVSDWRITGVSQDGGVVAGFYARASASGAFRWDAEGGVRDFGALPEGATGFEPQVVSRDGSTITGFSQSATGDGNVMRWSAAGFEVLASAASGSFGERLLRSSADGSRIGGTTDTNGLLQVFRAGMDGLAFASVDGAAQMVDMTPDGAVFIGNGTYGGNGPGFIWRPSTAEAPASNGLRYLSDMLEASGVDQSGWVIGPATSVSSDGRVVFGHATCGGVPAFYRWVLPE